MKRLRRWAPLIAVALVIIGGWKVLDARRKTIEKQHEGHETFHAKLAVELISAEPADLLVCQGRFSWIVIRNLGDQLQVRGWTTHERYMFTIENFAKGDCEPVKFEDPRYKQLLTQALGVQ